MAINFVSFGNPWLLSFVIDSYLAACEISLVNSSTLWIDEVWRIEWELGMHMCMALHVSYTCQLTTHEEACMHTYGHAPVFLHLECDSMQCALQEFPQSFFILPWPPSVP